MLSEPEAGGVIGAYAPEGLRIYGIATLSLFIKHNKIIYRPSASNPTHSTQSPVPNSVRWHHIRQAWICEAINPPEFRSIAFIQFSKNQLQLSRF